MPPGAPSERQPRGQVLGRHDRDDVREPRWGVRNDRSVDHMEPVDPVDASEVVDDVTVRRRRAHPAGPHHVRDRVGVLDQVLIPGHPVGWQIGGWLRAEAADLGSIGDLDGQAVALGQALEVGRFSNGGERDPSADRRGVPIEAGPILGQPA